jgi:hypothetical protein
VILIASSTVSASDYLEIASGDLSGNRLAPTNWTLAAGTNRLIATTSPGDQEYLRVNIPTGHRLGSIFVQFFSTSDVAFIGVQQGTTFSVTPESATAADMYGYAHFGQGGGNVGTDILDDMGDAPGATGFIPPLASGSYTFWLQQGTPPSTTYQLNFNVLRPGDYNGDGSVNAADYTVWRNTVGSTTDFRADNTGPSGMPDGLVNRLDFDYWKQHYGEGAGSGAAIAESPPVPEPAASLLALVGLCGLASIVTDRERRRPSFYGGRGCLRQTARTARIHQPRFQWPCKNGKGVSRPNCETPGECVSEPYSPITPK